MRLAKPADAEVACRRAEEEQACAPDTAVWRLHATFTLPQARACTEVAHATDLAACFSAEERAFESNARRICGRDTPAARTRRHAATAREDADALASTSCGPAQRVAGEEARSRTEATRSQAEGTGLHAEGTRSHAEGPRWESAGELPPAPRVGE